MAAALLVLFVLAPGATGTGQSPLRASIAPPAAKAAVETSFGKLPLGFERNQGQADAGVDFLAQGAGSAVFLSRGEAVLVLDRGTASSSDASARRAVRVRLGLVGGSRRPLAVAERRLPGRVNSMIGNDPRDWRSGIATYAKVRYRDVYPGVDVVYYGDQRRLEYDFVVAPTADPRSIGLRLSGSERLRLNPRGDLVLSRGLRLGRPLAYQERAGVRRWVAARYVLTGWHQVGLRLGSYDRTRPLVIDPVLAYATYLGGSGADVGWAIAVDGSGSAYVTGETFSSDFPTVAPFQAALAGERDVFVAKLNASGSALVYSSYLGGGGLDRGFAIALDSDRNAYIAGDSYSGNFPTTAGAFQTSFGGGEDAVIAKLDPSGGLLYSTYLGGSEGDAGFGIAVDGSGAAYATGETGSSDFPTTPAVVQTAFAGQADGFAVKLNPTGSALSFSTYLGGSGVDAGFGIAVDPTGTVYLGGESFSGDFPTTPDAFQTAYGGGSNDAFAAKLNPTASALLYSTYLGGSDFDLASSIALDGSGSLYLGGNTYSSNFPTTAGAFQTSFGGGSQDAFVAKLNPSGSALSYSTYLGGSALELGRHIAVDTAGSAYLVGETFSSDFPTSSAFQPRFGGNEDAFVTKLNGSGSALLYSSYLGGSGVDAGFGIAIDTQASPNAYLTGVTESTDFPSTAGAFQTATAGASDAFVAKIAAAPAPSTSTLYLHGSGGTANPPTLTLDRVPPTASSAKYSDSAGISFSGGNPWKPLGTWTAAPATSTQTLVGLSDLHAWLGLKSSDDQGTQFDLRAELTRNGGLVDASTTRCITGVTRNPDLAKEVTAAFDPFAPTAIASGDVLSLKLLTRIGTNPDGTKCSGPGGSHSSAVGLRAYFDAISRSARFTEALGP